MVQKPSLAESARPASHDSSRPYVFLKSSYLLTMFKEQSNPTLPTPAQCGHLVITDSFLCPWGKPLQFLLIEPA